MFTTFVAVAVARVAVALPDAEGAGAAGGATPWWVWLVAGLAVSFGVSMLVGHRLGQISDAHLPIAAAAPPDDDSSTASIAGLTSLADRRRLDRDLPDALGRGHAPVGFLVIDVDDFAGYTDANGPAAGDHVLRTLADVLARKVRPTDVIYRYGDQELCVLLADAAPDEAGLVAERIRTGVEAVEFPAAGSQPGGRITVSVGLAVAAATDPTELTERADAALHAAKEGGGNRVEVAAVG
jgi:diguanylate cyclase (GGDEF)-like protein